MKKEQNTTVSIGYWMFALLISWLPLINLICVPCLAFIGRNETKKNFFKAMIAWILLLIAVHLCLILAFGWHQIADFIKDYLNSN